MYLHGFHWQSLLYNHFNSLVLLYKKWKKKGHI
jgi:hypothetical protein